MEVMEWGQIFYFFVNYPFKSSGFSQVYWMETTVYVSVTACQMVE